ncbi:glycosyltransferase family 2 protein [Trichococcus sp. K1Tr]|uniref:glycosyltransferase family 2 protein n=1 Tax=Trichococcus sp. K1Tr TaxID=3020847 RepID=UPI002330C6B9|nr:glycosyltransferase family 2 protein [Trichococcus sp. K1Tr]
MGKSVHIVVLNYNGYEDTIACVDSLMKIQYENFKIIVVDNASANDLSALQQNLPSEIILLQSGKNLGYAGGNNVGIRWALENGADYVCVLNNDTEVDPGFLKQLVDFAEANPDYGMVGPAILEFDEPEIVQTTGAKINISKGADLPLNQGKHIDEVEKVISCDYIGGACMLVRKEVMVKIGLIPENYFLFYEETEWCCRAKQAGYGVYCLTSAHIYHKGSSSINKVKGLSKYLLYRNRVVFVKRNGTFSEKVKFFVYLGLKMVQTLVFDFSNREEIKYYLHGVFNIIDKKKYPFIIINQ